MALPSLNHDMWIEVLRRFSETVEDPSENPSNWLPLRLVSKLFNREILFIFFVLHREIGQYQRPLIQWERAGDRPLNRYSRLQNCWWLQGLVIRSYSAVPDSHTHHEEYLQRLQWKSCVDEAAHLLSEHADRTNSHILDVMHPRGFLADLSSPFVALHRAKELVCDAYASLMAAQNIRDEWPLFDIHPMHLFEHPGNSHGPERFVWTGVDMFFLASCYLGQVSTFEYGTILSGCQERSLEDSMRLRSAGLYVAIREDKRPVISSLLSSLSPMSNDTWCCALAAATAVGNIWMVQVLLEPEFSRGRGEYDWPAAIMCATEHEEPVTRLKMLELIFLHMTDVSSKLRIEMLVHASRCGDIDFARWVIESGPVDFYHERFSATSPETRYHPLVMAVKHHQADMVRFLLGIDFKVNDEGYSCITRSAFKYVVRDRHLDTFKALMPCFAHLDLHLVLSCAASIEYAIESVDVGIGPIDLNASIFPFDDKSLGSHAIERSIRDATPENLHWILSHGYRTGERITVRTNLSNGLSDLARMEEMLKSFGNPGILIECDRKHDEDLATILQLPEPLKYTCECSEDTE